MRLGKREVIGLIFLVIVLGAMFVNFMLQALTYHCPPQKYPISPQHPVGSCFPPP